MFVKGKQVRICKMEVMACFKVLSQLSTQEKQR